ncbi:MAG: hypothetical protein AAGA30_00985 [Planctomycetota bacterium]
MSSQFLEALELAKNGDWEAAHQIVQDLNDAKAAQIHGYLHRVEGDDGNAAYWYRRAGVPFPQVSVDEEWQQIHDSLN